MSSRPEPQEGILQIAPYIPGKSSARPGQVAIKLSSNESPLGMSPLAVKALDGVAGQLSGYPDGASTRLREAIAEVQGLEAERIVIGAGSDELLHLLAQTYLGEGDEAIISEFGFLVYPIVTLGAGAQPVIAPDKDYVVDVDAVLAAVTDKTRVVWLANPNNPTGTYLSDAQVRRLHAGLRPDILFVVDNAYAEYVTAADFATGFALVREAENVVMVRTFSKMGLAGLRVGWLYGPDHIVDAVNRLRGPFNVSIPAQVAGEAAARDVEFADKLKAHNARWRDWLVAELDGNRMRVLPSQGNFVLVLFESPKAAAEALAALGNAGIVVREMGGYGLPQALRISIGKEDAMKTVAKTLCDFAAGAR